MQVHRDLEHLPSFNKSVITIGAFDGVHLAHQKILRQVKKSAKACGGESIVVTFFPHPRVVLFPSRPLDILSSIDEKAYLLEQQGIDHLIVVPFTREFSEQSATTYIEEFLVEKINPYLIVIGYDHHFGHNREGDIKLLMEVKDRYGIKVEEIPEQICRDTSVSSTQIRNFLNEGQIDKANELLGYPYFVSGKVTHGDERGRTIGFPTINVESENELKLIPAEGVYATTVDLPFPKKTEEKSRSYGAAANIGFAPTFNRKEKRLEAFLLDFDENIYGEHVRVNFHHYLRPDKKFDTKEALIARMDEDVEQVQKELKARHLIS